MGPLSAVDLVGRERELEAGRRFLAAVPSRATALVFCGEAGIGKTALWGQVSADARATGYRVLTSRCVEAEMPLGFATLADLVEEAFDEVADELPPVQRAGLDFALRRIEFAGGAPDAFTVARAVLGVLRLLAVATPVILAIDDVQWVDRASARVLSFALRRLEREPVGVLATERPAERIEDRPALGGTLTELGASSIELRPLGVTALRDLVRLRTATQLPRPILARLHEASGGNPMYALEFARVVSESTPVDVLPMPSSLRALVRDRLAVLPVELRPLLELAATLGRPTLELLQLVSGGHVDTSLETAVEAGALVVDDDGFVRFSHPLLASAVSADTSPARRRAIHRAAADAISDEEERVRHLALAALQPDEKVASALDRAAARAHGRGAPDAAAELAEWAQRLTPLERRSERDRRVIEAAGYLVESGDEAGARRLLDPLLDGTIPDAVRAEALLVRASAEWNDRPALLRLLRQALEHARDEPRLRCEALIRYAFQAGHLSGDEVAAEVWAREALTLAQDVGDPGLREQAAALVLFVAAFRAVSAGELPSEPPESTNLSARTAPWGQPRRAVVGLQLMWRGRLDEARALLERELARVSAQGSEIRLATLSFNLAELELRAGNWALASRHAQEGLGIMREVGGEGEMILRGARGRVAAHQGRVAEAVADLDAALERAEFQSNAHQFVRTRMSLGFLHLSQGKPELAWQALEGLPELRERMGVGEPGALPLQADAVETLVVLDRLAEAEALVVRLEEQGRALEHPWAVPVAARCRGLVLLARGSLDASMEALESSAHGFEQIGYPFDRARSLFALGGALRRAGQRRRAATRLEEARSLFERLGAQLWLERAETELRRAAPRPRRDRELTAAETRVARLVAAGATNKEAAARLFTTVHTVEAHLTRIYRKLGLRSRSELVRKVVDGTVELSDT